MFHVDVPRVRGKIAEKGMTVTSVAERANISRNTLANYLENPEKMPYSMIILLANMLCSDEAEAEAIFFAPDLRNT